MPLGLILSKVERNVLDFFSPQYFRVPFKIMKVTYQTAMLCEDYSVSDGETF